MVNSFEIKISIHAPHTRSDNTNLSFTIGSRDFNPRPSYEERPDNIKRNFSNNKISIHAPHTRSDGA